MNKFIDFLERNFWSFWFMLWGIMILTFLLVGCSTPPEKPDVSVYYEKDLKVCVNKECFHGVGVPNPAVSYDIEVKSRGDNDYLLFESCSRWKKFEGEGKRVKYRYTPMDELENSGECPLDITSLETRKKRHGWARIAFLDAAGKYSLPAYLRCNGQEGQTKHGISICQSADGLLQQINFSVPVYTSRTGDCVMPASDDSRKFTFKMPKHDCVFKFKEKGEDRWHMLYTIGFDQSLFRGD